MKKRSFDFITVYTISLLLFNLSTFLGVVKDPYSRNYVEPNEYLFFYSSIPFLVVSFFLLFKKEKNKNSRKNNLIKKDYTILLNLLLIFFIVCFFDNREAFLGSAAKMNMVQELKFTSMLLLPIPSVGATLALVQKKYFYLFLYFSCALVLFLMGSRSPLAILGLCLTLQILSKKKILIIKHYKVIILGALGLFLIVIGKRLYGSILAYGLIEGFISWYQNFNMMYLKEGSEFLSTPLILNAVIENNFFIPTTDILGSLLAILPIPMSFWGLSSGVFNEKFQSVLFSDMNYGMAYNIWAEAYSWFDFCGVLIYAVCIPLLLSFLWNIYIYNKKNAFGMLILLIGVLFSFWIHRNSLGSILGYIRNALYPILFLMFFANVIFFVVKQFKRNL